MIERIDSPANKKIKLAAALKQRKQREKTGLFVAEGIRLCEMAAEAGWQVEFGLLTGQVMAQERGAKLVCANSSCGFSMAKETQQASSAS